jgi:hypothetical protein
MHSISGFVMNDMISIPSKKGYFPLKNQLNNNPKNLLPAKKCYWPKNQLNNNPPNFYFPLKNLTAYVDL